MPTIVRLEGGGVADMTWHGPDRRRAPRDSAAPAEYELAVLSPSEFDELVAAAHGDAGPARTREPGRAAA